MRIKPLLGAMILQKHVTLGFRNTSLDRLGPFRKFGVEDLETTISFDGILSSNPLSIWP
jgi:hypothetical protein